MISKDRRKAKGKKPSTKVIDLVAVFQESLKAQKCGKEEEERATESKTSREESGLIRGRQFSGEKS
jgi:predicted HNH restriction endonuclease